MRPPVGLGAALLIAIWAAAAVAASANAAAAPVGLSVTITDGVGQVSSKDALTYAATLTNSGASPVVTDLVLTVPAYARYTNRGGAVVEKQNASWSVKVAAGKSVTKSVAVTLGAIPAGQLRVTALASVYLPGTQPRLLIRSADADMIRGVADPAHTVIQAAPAPARGGGGGGETVVIAGAVVVLVLFIGGGAVWWRRRSRPVEHPADDHNDARAGVS